MNQHVKTNGHSSIGSAVFGCPAEVTTGTLKLGKPVNTKTIEAEALWTFKLVEYGSHFAHSIEISRFAT